MNKKNATGFSLVELLVATSLLMAVLYIGYMSYSMYSRTWEKQVDHFWEKSNSHIALNQLVRVLEGTVPYVVLDVNNNHSLFIEGSETSLKVVTSAPIFSEDYAVVELVLEGSEGGYDLIYKESPIPLQPLYKQKESREWKNQVVLIDDISHFQFLYYGYENFEAVNQKSIEKQEFTANKSDITPSWHRQFNTEKRRVLPVSIGINIQFSVGESDRLAVAMPENSMTRLVKYLRVDI